MISGNIQKALHFAEKLVGTKYGPWINGKDTRATEAPFWVSGEKPPSPAYVKARSSNCAGFINLLRREAGLPIPGMEKKDCKYAGGTWIWFNYLKKQGVLEFFDISKRYPAGTLLLRNYSSFADQGHVAVIFEAHKKNVLYSKLLHCYTAELGSRKKKQIPGIALDGAVGMSHFWKPEGYYTHACLPKCWLGKD